MEPSDQLLGLLQGVFRDDARSKILYPALLLARRVALNIRGLNVDPDRIGVAERPGPGLRSKKVFRFS